MGRISKSDRQYNYVLLAENEYMSDNKEKAIEFYKKALTFRGNIEDIIAILYNIAEIYDEMGAIEMTMEYYKMVLDLDPDDYITYNNIGSIYEELKDYSNAYIMVKKSLELQPDYYKSLFNMGVIYKGMGDNRKALAYYFKSLDANKEYSYTYLNISAIYIEEERYEDTIEILTEGIEKNSDAHDLYYNRACCYSILNYKEDALNDLKIAKELLPEIVAYIRTDKDFENLYECNEFQEIIKE